MLREIAFVDFCKDVEETYENVKFFGGRRKYDWAMMYIFKTEDVPLRDRYSSTTRFIGNKDESTLWNKFLNIMDDWFPWAYAKTHNHVNYLEYMLDDTNEVFFFDFVNMR